MSDDAEKTAAGYDSILLGVDTTGSIHTISGPDTDLISTTGIVNQPAISSIGSWTWGSTGNLISESEKAKLLALDEKIADLLPQMSKFEKAYLLFKLIQGNSESIDNQLKSKLESIRTACIEGSFRIWDNPVDSSVYESSVKDIESRIAQDVLENSIKETEQ